MTSRSGPRRRLTGVVLVATAAVVTGCRNPSQVVVPPLEAVVASGDSQYGTAGQQLTTPLQVAVRNLANQVPYPGAAVSWAVVSGDASFVGLASSATDSAGIAGISVRLGTTTGPITIRATAELSNRPSADFELFLVDQPVLSGLTPLSAEPGDTISLTGSNFSPVPEQNVVLFSGIRGSVVSASATQLSVEVPSCLPARGVGVTTQLGTVASASRTLSVTASATPLSIAPGEVADIADDAAFDCLTLAGDAVYLAIPYSASTVGGAEHAFELTGLSSAVPLAAAPPPQSRAPHAPRTGWVDVRETHDRFELYLRQVEERLLEDRLEPLVASLEGPAASPPVVGERREFEVFQADGTFATVDATAHFVGDEVAIFIDRDAPAGGFTATDLQALAARFDHVIHPVVTLNFGNASDLDGNERVIVLLTPVVNALTPRGASGFVGGFFFGIDLLPGEPGSNGGEVFYSLVPDPDGLFSDARSKSSVLDVVPAILAHEFQHMVHFNERVLELQAESQEAIWFSEGLAQFAEEAVARSYEVGGDSQSASLFRDGNRIRARRYLARPDTISVIFSGGQGTLEERGGALLLTTYLEDQIGGDLLRRLTRTTRTGVANVEAETATSWDELLGNWWTAIYNDGPGPESGVLTYPSVDLKGFLGNPFPLTPVALGGGDFTEVGSLWSSAGAYYIVIPPSGGTTTLRLAGEGGGPLSAPGAMRLRVLRIS